MGGSSNSQHQQVGLSYHRRQGAALTLVRLDLSDAPLLNRRRPGSLYSMYIVSLNTNKSSSSSSSIPFLFLKEQIKGIIITKKRKLKLLLFICSI
jgi:hypothetical protein